MLLDSIMEPSWRVHEGAILGRQEVESRTSG